MLGTRETHADHRGSTGQRLGIVGVVSQLAFFCSNGRQANDQISNGIGSGID